MLYNKLKLFLKLHCRQKYYMCIEEYYPNWQIYKYVNIFPFILSLTAGLEMSREVSWFPHHTCVSYILNHHCLQPSCDVTKSCSFILVLKSGLTRAQRNFSPFSRRTWKQPPSVKLCTWIILHGEAQTPGWSNSKQNKFPPREILLQTGWALTAALAVAVRSDENVHAYEGQQRPLEFGTGSVEQWTEGGGIPHVQLVGVSRQNVTDAQKSLIWNNERKSEGVEGRVNGAIADKASVYASCPAHLLPHARVRVGETAMTPLTEETQLESLGHSFLLNTHTFN